MFPRKGHQGSSPQYTLINSDFQLFRKEKTRLYWKRLFCQRSMKIYFQWNSAKTPNQPPILSPLCDRQKRLGLQGLGLDTTCHSTATKTSSISAIKNTKTIMQGGTIKLYPSSRNLRLTCTYPYRASHAVNLGVFMLFCFLFYMCLKNQYLHTGSKKNGLV